MSQIKNRKHEWYLKNRERILAKRKLEYPQKKDAIAQWHSDHYAKNKERINAKKHEWYLKNSERVKSKARLHYFENRDYYIAKRASYAKSHRDSENKKHKKYCAGNKGKMQCRMILYNALKYGYITRPGKCSECGKECKAEGHHHKGYAKENALNVIWLCKRCHWKHHTKPI